MQGKRWCLDNIKMVSRGQTFNFNLRPGQVRTDQVRSGKVSKGKVRNGQVKTGQVRTGPVKSGHTFILA